MVSENSVYDWQVLRRKLYPKANQSDTPPCHRLYNCLAKKNSLLLVLAPKIPFAHCNGTQFTFLFYLHDLSPFLSARASAQGLVHAREEHASPSVILYFCLVLWVSHDLLFLMP